MLGGLRPAKVRLAPPVRSGVGRLIVDGWTAAPFLEGGHEPGRWTEIVEIGRRLNCALAGVARPDFLDRRSSPWGVADRMTWDEAPVGGLMDFAPIARLAAMRRPIDAASQVIHGDLCGNVLFSDGERPAVIDFSPYWRPAAYSVALVVGDAIVSEGAPADLVSVLDGGPDRGQLLVRALLFRALVDALRRSRRMRPTSSPATCLRSSSPSRSSAASSRDRGGTNEAPMCRASRPLPGLGRGGPVSMAPHIGRLMNVALEQAANARSRARCPK